MLPAVLAVLSSSVTDMTYAVVNSSNLVINIILWDGQSPWFPPDGCVAIKIPENVPVTIGWSYIDGQFVPPPEPEPVPPSTDSQPITQEV